MQQYMSKWSQLQDDWLGADVATTLPLTSRNALTLKPETMCQKTFYSGKARVLWLWERGRLAVCSSAFSPRTQECTLLREGVPVFLFYLEGRSQRFVHLCCRREGMHVFPDPVGQGNSWAVQESSTNIWIEGTRFRKCRQRIAEWPLIGRVMGIDSNEKSSLQLGFLMARNKSLRSSMERAYEENLFWEFPPYNALIRVQCFNFYKEDIYKCLPS